MPISLLKLQQRTFIVLILAYFKLSNVCKPRSNRINCSLTQKQIRLINFTEMCSQEKTCKTLTRPVQFNVKWTETKYSYSHCFYYCYRIQNKIYYLQQFLEEKCRILAVKSQKQSIKLFSGLLNQPDLTAALLNSLLSSRRSNKDLKQRLKES